MRPLIAGNWKMHGLGPQLGEIEAIAASVKAAPPFADILVCLPATLIARAVQTAGGRIAIGGEDCSSRSRLGSGGSRPHDAPRSSPLPARSWGPKDANAIIASDGGWHNPDPREASGA